MKTTTLLLSILLCTRVMAQAGELDLNFSADGIVTTSTGNVRDARAIALQADGKILVAGSAALASKDFAVARYLPDGTLDATFSGDGIATIGLSEEDVANTVLVQPDGKILLGGYYTTGGGHLFGVARFNSNGTPDTGFGLNGLTLSALSNTQDPPDDKAFAMALQPDGKILLAGTTLNGTETDIGLMRFYPDGSIDNSFSFDGIVSTDIQDVDAAYAIAVGQVGRILVAGSTCSGLACDYLLVRYTSAGELDPTFGVNGVVITDHDAGSFDDGRALAIAGNGMILLGGSTGTNLFSSLDFSVLRYLSNGTLDPSFSGDGKASLSPGSYGAQGRSVAVQADGKILLGGATFDNGSNSGFGLARFTGNGSVDAAFNSGGWLSTEILGDPGDGRAIALQTDGKILMAGSRLATTNSFAVVRYLNDVGIGIPEINTPIASAQIFPSLVTDDAVLRYNLESAGKVSITAIDPTGRIVRTFINSGVRKPGPQQETLSFGGLASGRYQVVITVDGIRRSLVVTKE
ncbi:MAG TPA: hypothetical protein PLV08_06745 [Flavobacteriales bacterium]|jgi:uncharacterized delta-60 repeat protein|nr:hypothetical protein [Flavobacteriales bacterium]MBK7112742.1 hypothetical protein [Flavobacteriales bacterium]MBK7620588.1 hypothetical protein [Flavobacteriales bacterium]MBK8708468.1 hypothetical protein [Flavobacteriales bacterium]MBP8877761.1 hypothetical protein [Flavobacteriales bacterium]